MTPRFQAPKGTLDLLPPESARFQALVGEFARLAGAAGYGLIVGPMFEALEVYERVGESTDIVRKEMYDFEDKGGRRLALRPDSTPSVVRAFVQHRPLTPWKVWYVGPHFRYDRPQKGRYRQHHQVGLECLGSEDPDLDVEVIGVACELYASLGLTRVELHLNSMGDEVCRPAYRELLLEYLAGREGELCEEHREHYRGNPMRLFDCKREPCRVVTQDAPQLSASLCDPCSTHFGAVQHGLEESGIEFLIDDRLVRGQDYYTRTTFEFAGLALDAAQNSLGGGGRYDGFTEALGGPPTPGIGFGLGVERILDASEAEGTFALRSGTLDVFVVDTTGGGEARRLTRELRSAGLSADRAFDGRSMGSQMKAADRSGARAAVIVGAEERAEGKLTVRDLRSGDQQKVAAMDLVEHLRALSALSEPREPAAP